MPETLGMVAGFSSGAAETPVAIKAATTGTVSFVESLYENPTETAAAIREQIEAIAQLENWPEYAEAIAQSYEQQMDAENPYEEDAEEYQTFRENYYAGILLFEIALGVATGGTVQAAKQSATASKIATAASGTKLATAARAVSRTYRGVSAPSRYVKSKLVVTGVRAGSLSVDATKALYSGSRTVGSTITTSQRLPSVDLDVSSLTRAQQRALGRELPLTEGGIDLDARIERLLIDSETIDPELAGRLQRLRDDGDLSDADVDRLEELVQEGKMDKGDADSLVSLLQKQDNSELISDALEPDDVLQVSRENGDLSETISVTKSQEGDVVFLEAGDDVVGWQKIRKKHITGDISGGSKFPTRFSNQEIKKMILEAVEETEPRQVELDNGRTGYEYTYSVPGEDFPIRVATGSNGFIVSAFPLL